MNNMNNIRRSPLESPYDKTRGGGILKEQILGHGELQVEKSSWGRIKNHYPHTLNNKLASVVLLISLLTGSSAVIEAAEIPPQNKPNSAHNSHDKPSKWPEPVVVESKYDGQPVASPAGALILFDGKDATAWTRWRFTGPSDLAEVFPWKIENGYMEVVQKTNRIVTRKPVITSGHLHIEWATPAMVKGDGQGRGNNGVFIEGFPEVQILDSYNNKTYPEGQAAALYGLQPPLVNASNGPGLWQCYDIYIQRAKVENGKIKQPATITVYHNNVLVQDKVEIANSIQAGTLNFQDRQPVRFRNIWFLPSN